MPALNPWDKQKLTPEQIMLLNAAGPNPEETAGGPIGVTAPSSTPPGIDMPDDPNRDPAAIPAPLKPVLPANAVVARPGDNKTQNTVTSDQNQKQQSSYALTWNDPDWAKMLDRVSQSPYIQEQTDQLQALRSLAGKTAELMPNNLDLTPLANLAEYETGHRPQYTPPATPQAQRAQLMAYADELQKRQGDISKQSLEMLKAQKAGTQMDQYLQALKESQGAGIQPVRPNNFAATNARGFLGEINKRMSPADTERATELANIVKAINSNDPAEQRGVPIMLTKFAVGSARMAMQEVQQEGGDPSAIQSLLARAERLGSGQMTKKNQDEYLDMAHDFAETFNQNRRNQRDILMNLAPTLGMSPQDAKRSLPDSFVNLFQVPKSSQDVKNAATQAILKQMQESAKQRQQAIDLLNKK